MREISREEAKRVAELARLALSEEEAEKMARTLNQILRYVEKLNELDTEEVPPTSHVLGITNVMRADEVRPSWPIEEVLKNAPDKEERQFKVPAIMGE
ncbi:Aspartyl/glutamyl-tRNA(Asn/Gln) amidotransferase subunit C [[Clostridium] ultunense Esp]|uniref:Asp-tRNA(Asn)/Glu-tRNA(Gln) amidotransferase subunit GatC n=1 Tax=Thermicanus aegyptius TaxID=94009 RepID=UPI0002B6EF64|nr:Asp-tRNA(Asn)/Glu-tRNA(Gln) amidotransferase subunit GatC [Thermicanus aegyptius]MBE3554193.1 Asp-tRNA(Asn)/Glu-tRNA(Gln) amidotransferase subunit GatC [Thermicanus sp.]CCQ92519.1 Aspartyl/glutamyl-tRNA(Asn/Gln) amidotransferase subunit C [[Clostridium] ultunense Esp]